MKGRPRGHACKDASTACKGSDIQCFPIIPYHATLLLYLLKECDFQAWNLHHPQGGGTFFNPVAINNGWSTDLLFKFKAWILPVYRWELLAEYGPSHDMHTYLYPSGRPESRQGSIGAWNSLSGNVIIRFFHCKYIFVHGKKRKNYFDKYNYTMYIYTHYNTHDL